MLEYGMKTSAICSYFLGGEIADSKLYLFPCRYEGILIFDLNEKKFDKVIRIDDSWKDLDGVYSFKGACIHESKIFIASMKENFYEIIDLASETRKRVTLKDDYKGITHLLVRDNELVLVGHNGKIGFYDFDGERKHITQFELTTDVHKFFDVCEKNGVLFLTENDKNKVAVYDTLSNEKEELNYPICEEKELKEFWAHFTFIKCEDDEMILQSAYDGGICCINGRHIEKIADVDWTITDEERKLLNFELEGIVTEQFGCDLKWFLGKLGLFNK
jgi:hypothetical protein